MQSEDHETLAAAMAWLDAGRRVALVTVARTWGSAPRPIGSWLALADDGRLAGSVSGGCVEDDLMQRLPKLAAACAGPQVLRYGAGPDTLGDFSLPCGATLELVAELTVEAQGLSELATCLSRGERVLRCLDLVSGAARLVPADANSTVAWDGQTLQTPHGPRHRLLLIGAGPIAAYLARMAPAIDFAVTVCDPREEYALGWDVRLAPLTRAMPDDAVTAFEPDAASAVIALTHDPKLDDLALIDALATPAFYVGALGSARNQARRRERLGRYFDLAPEQLARLHGPVGLPIGSRTPAEIAISILAELIAVTLGASIQAAAARPLTDVKSCVA